MRKKFFISVILFLLIAISMISCEKQPLPEGAVYCSHCNGTGTVWPGVGLFKIFPSDCPACYGMGYFELTWVPTSSNQGNVSFKGTHCNGIVGCSCPGFEPITNEELYKKQYCKHCGHHKKYHK